MKLFTRQEGSVSVFLLIITAAIVMFTALLIDLSRIVAANKQAELAAQAGVRSVLSAYDRELNEAYGLFARGGTPSEQLFAHTAEQYLESALGEGFRLLDMQVRSAYTNSGQALGMHQVFVRQVLEEMKYKAPVNLMLDIAAKLKPLAGQLEQAERLTAQLGDMQRLYDERNQLLHQTIALLHQAAEGAELRQYIQLANEKSTDSPLEAVYQQYGEYWGWKLELAMVQNELIDAERQGDADPAYVQEQEEQIMELAQQILAYEGEVRRFAAAVAELQAQASEAHNTAISEARQKFELAKAVNEQMRSAASSEPGGSQGNGFRLLGRNGQIPETDGGSGAGLTGASVEDVGDHIDLESLILPPSWWDSFGAGMDSQSRLFAQVRDAAAATASTIEGAIRQAVGMKQLYAPLEGWHEANRNYKAAYIEPADQLAILEGMVRQMLDSNDDDELQEQRKLGKDLWQEVKAMLGRIGNAAAGEGHSEAFRELQARHDAAVLVQRALFEAQSGMGGEDEDPAGAASVAAASDYKEGQKAAEGGFAGTNKIYESIGNLLGQARDRVYLNEYAYEKFSAYPPQELKARLMDAQEPELPGVSEQQLEYILFGFHHPAANLAAAYGELFLLRLAIRTMEGLIECRAAGGPLLVMAAALVYGLQQSLADMIAIWETGEAPLTKYLSLKLSYADYMRLFLFVQGSELDKAARMIALIEYETGYRLLGMETEVSGELHTALRLWFLPGIMRLLNRSELLGGKVVGNYYETVHTLASSY